MLYLYNNDEIATTLHDNGTSSILRTNVHALLFVHKQSGSERTELLARDVKGSTLTLLTINSTAPVAFNPWGYFQAAGGMLAGFKGEYCDPVTSDYLLGNGYRGYNPMLMRFTSPDSVSPFAAGGINCYAYLSGDPVNASDPTGHMRAKVLLREPNLGVFTSRKRFWKKKELNIYAHGKNSKVAGMDADALYEHLSRQKISFDGYEKIHVIACHSGEPGPNGQLSFGQHFSNKTRKIVKAYSGTVSTISNPQQDNQYTRIKILRQNIYKTKDFNYTPVTFQPMVEQASIIRSRT
ncbi:RHS repeat-associated core domain-containing protein [Pseudomonas sp. SID14000]|uniref:RHS repeat-associated core domain-containing protein n=1 Tax=Pseudomonas sp. SID14000 TaxID=1986221 RepID=UPI000B3D049A|nr:RHS repeat-associated core domain-containing protein [Pseudomonas sp. SID14000]